MGISFNFPSLINLTAIESVYPVLILLVIVVYCNELCSKTTALFHTVIPEGALSIPEGPGVLHIHRFPDWIRRLGSGTPKRSPDRRACSWVSAPIVADLLLVGGRLSHRDGS